jgi:hypothetical protein
LAAREAKVIIQAIPGWSAALRDLLRGLEFCTAEDAMQALSGAQMYMESLWATHVPVPERTSLQAMLVPMMNSSPNRMEGMDTSSPWLALACHLNHPRLFFATDESVSQFAQRTAALASAGIDALGPRSSGKRTEKTASSQRGERLLLTHNTDEPSPPAAAGGPAPHTTAERVMAQLSNLLSECATFTDEGEADETKQPDETSAAAAKQLFEWMVTTSEKLADAESRLLLYKQEEEERQQVQ